MARIRLGLSNDDFFRLTPRQLHLLIDRERERRDHLEWMMGTIASEIANHSLNPPQTWAAPATYMTSYRKQSERKVERVDRKAVATNIRSFLVGQMRKQQQKAS